MYYERIKYNEIETIGLKYYVCIILIANYELRWAVTHE